MSITPSRAVFARSVFAATISSSLFAASALAAPIPIAAPFAANYTAEGFTGPDTLPPLYGGLVFKAGDSSTILVGGNANGAAGAIYSIPVTRDVNGHVNGFGAATLFATAPYIDGGLAYGPGGVLFYTAYPVNQIGQIKPGSAVPDRVDGVGIGIGASVGSLNFIPAGFPNAGQLMVASYNGGQYGTAAITPDGFGTFDIGTLGNITPIGGGPEGFVFIGAGNPNFSVNSILVSEYSAGKVSAYDLDPITGMPVIASQRDFISSLSGAEGAAIDPLTGDFLFSTFGGGNQIVVVQGFLTPLPPEVGETPIPGALPLFATGLGALGLVTWRRKRKAVAA